MTDLQAVAQAQRREAGHGHWINDEIDRSVFKDARLARQLSILLGQLAKAPGHSIALVCQDWANTKAAYRFLSNENVSEADILAGHFKATQERIAASIESPVLMLHDTTEFSWERESSQSIGMLGTTNSGCDAQGRVRHHTVCGLLMHSSLAVTCDGLPLGLAAVKFWSRSKFKGTNALKRSINPTRVPIEENGQACAGWTTCVSRVRCLCSPSSACTSVTGAATSTSCFARHTMRVRTSSFVPAPTGLPAMARTRWRHTCGRFAVGICTWSKCVTVKAIAAARCSN